MKDSINPTKPGWQNGRRITKLSGPDGNWITVNRALDREKWHKLKDAYYTERGWDLTTGIPTRARLEDLDLKDILLTIWKRANSCRRTFIQNDKIDRQGGRS
jgi:hypothetical protein